MFLTPNYDCQTEGGGRELINQMIHGMWNIRRQWGERVFFMFQVCVCVYVCVFNCVKCNKSQSVLNRQTVVLRCPEGNAMNNVDIKVLMFDK